MPNVYSSNTRTMMMGVAAEITNPIPRATVRTADWKASESSRRVTELDRMRERNT